MLNLKRVQVAVLLGCITHVECMKFILDKCRAVTPIIYDILFWCRVIAVEMNLCIINLQVIAPLIRCAALTLVEENKNCKPCHNISSGCMIFFFRNLLR